MHTETVVGPTPTFTSVTITGYIYFGDSDTDGSWRFRRVGNRWVSEYRESGVWNPKGGFSA